MKRNGEMDFYKFLFAILIVLFHSRNFSSTGTGGIFPLGAIGVEFYFIVSGYLMAASSAKVSLQPGQSVGPLTVHFIGRKIKGFIPDVYIAWIIAFIVVSLSKDFGFRQVLSNGVSSIYDLLFLTHSGLFGFVANGACWYLSAMLLAMAILYPILIKNRPLFLTLLAPLIAVFMLGYMYQNFEAALGGASKWIGFAYKGFLRGLAEICLGCACYSVCQKLKGLKPTKLLGWLVALLQAACFASVIALAHFKTLHSTLDFLMVLALAIGITLTFSQLGIWSSSFSSPIWSKLGLFSFDLFLSHGFWSRGLKVFLDDWGYWKILPVYIALSVITALFVMFVSNFIKKKWPQISAGLKKALIQN